MGFLDWLFAGGDSICDRIGHNFVWVTSWRCMCCTTCGLTLVDPRPKLAPPRAEAEDAT